MNGVTYYLNIVVKNKKLPKKTEYNGYKIGNRFQETKGKIKDTENDLYQKLSKNSYVKKELDRYLSKLPDLTFNERKQQLFQYCNEKHETPKNKTEYNGSKIGGWFQKTKGKIKDTENDLYQKLSKNSYVKKELDRYLSKKGNKK